MVRPSADSVVPRLPGRPKSADLAARRDALLDAGWEEFVNFGIAGASFGRIAERCGISKMTVYRHFKRKEDLFNAIAARGADRIERRLTAIVERGGSVRSTLLKAVCLFTRAATQTSSLAVMRIALVRGEDCDLSQEMLRRFERTILPLENYLTRVALTRLTQGQAHRLATLLFSMASAGFMHMAVSTPTDEEILSGAEEVIDIFLTGFASKSLS